MSKPFPNFLISLVSFVSRTCYLFFHLVYSFNRGLLNSLNQMYTIQLTSINVQFSCQYQMRDIIKSSPILNIPNKVSIIVKDCILMLQLLSQEQKASRKFFVTLQYQNKCSIDSISRFCKMFIEENQLFLN